MAKKDCSKHIEAREDEPIAVVGMSCRFPGGANDPDTYWQLLCGGVDAITEIPGDRWDIDTFYQKFSSEPGKTNTRWGGFIEEIDRFDADFFRISRREAAHMDPQQRLLLELAWEALEDSGQTKEQLAGSGTGVFVGASNQDFGLLQQSGSDLTHIDTHSSTGGALSILANRVSHFLDLRGPSLTVDTACSSSLVALHLGCRSLWEHECPAALVGGVNLLIHPGPFVVFSRSSMLSSDGRCKAFDAGADGYVRGEGAGFILIKPLALAEKDGDRIYALIRSTAVNQGGQAGGITVPSKSAQENLLRDACQRAGVQPNQIQFVEAHGTGTPVGDPIEALALGRVLRKSRIAGSHCIIGSVKTNIGHLEPAAGIAGLIKTALCLRHRMIPPNLHFNDPNPNIPFEDLKLRVLRSLEPWPETEDPALAAVCSYGFGGTNALALLEAAPPRNSAESTASGSPKAIGFNEDQVAFLFPLSARSAEALLSLARSYHDHLAHGAGLDVALEDVCWTAATRRDHHEHRAAFSARSKAELIESLGSFAEGKTESAIATGRCPAEPRNGLVFVCSGQGPQWWGMGRQLLTTQPVFRTKVERCDALIRDLGGWSLLEEMARDESSSRISETSIAQPAIFCIQIGLAELWKSWGIQPDAVVGHSVGEVAAGYLSGALSLNQAAQVIFHRSRCMDFAGAHGKMLVAALPVDEAEALIQESGPGQISLAAVNGPTFVTLSGDGETLNGIAAKLKRQGVFHQFLAVDYAFHSPLMDPAREELLQALSKIEPQSASTPLYSTVTGMPLAGTELDADYWWRNVRQPVRFKTAVDRILEDGHSVFLELSPHPVLSSSIADCASQSNRQVVVVQSLRHDGDDSAVLTRSLGALYTSGYPIAWEKALPKKGRFTRLPTYCWQRETLWSEPDEARQFRLGKSVHPLLGRSLNTPHPAWENRLSLGTLGFLRDHKVQGHVVLPSTAYLEGVLAVGRELFGADTPLAIDRLRLSSPCFPTETQPTTLRVLFSPDESTVRIYSKPPGPGSWIAHGRGTVRKLDGLLVPKEIDVDEVRKRCAVELTSEECYARLREMDLQFGKAFRAIERVWYGSREIVGRIRAPREIVDSLDGYSVHPAMLDACFQTVGVYLSQEVSAPKLYLPVEVEEARVYGRVQERLWSHARLMELSETSVIADFQIFDEDRRLLLEFKGARCQSVEGDLSERSDDLVFDSEWVLQSDGRGSVDRSVPNEVADPVATMEKAKLQTEKIDRELGLTRLCQRFDEESKGLWAASLLSALSDLGLRLEPGDGIESSADAHFRKGVSLDPCFPILEQEGVLGKEGLGWKVLSVSHLGNPAQRYRQLLEKYPGFANELILFHHYRQQLPQILSGEIDPLTPLVPDPTRTLAEQLWQSAPPLRLRNLLAQRLVGNLLNEWSSSRPMRVLEVGAGAGSMTAHVLAEATRAEISYFLTDPSHEFVEKLEERFSWNSSVKCRHLDLQVDPCRQGFEPHSFDVILTGDGLSLVPDFSRVVVHLGRLLASGGRLVLLGMAALPRFHEIFFQTIEGCRNSVETGLRPLLPLRFRAEWQKLLEEAGFGHLSQVSVGSSGAKAIGICARGPQSESDGQQPETTTVERPGPKAPGSWLILADQGGLGQILAEHLRSSGERCVIASIGTEFRQTGEEHFEISNGRAEAIRTILETAFEGETRPLRGVVFLWNLDLPEMGQTADQSPIQMAIDHCLEQAELAGMLNDLQVAEAPRLWLVTQGAHSVGLQRSAVKVAQGLIWGFGRVLTSEVPRLRPSRVDLSSSCGNEEIQSLSQEVWIDDDEDEIALRGEKRYVLRYRRRSKRDQRSAKKGAPAGNRSFKLTIPRPGSLDRLRFQEAGRFPPGPEQVEIEVAAAGLNFADLMKTLGLYPGTGNGRVSLGAECSGRVVAVGEGVRGIRPGEEVVAVAPYAIGSFATTSSKFVLPKPAHLSLEEAATVPIAFLTAHYALNYVGRLVAGERILIHSASGGVGLAAIQIATRQGAQIYATAGTPEKREFLRSLGIKHVADSRSLSFADQILDATNGEGVDLILNSLAGEAIGRGLAVLANYGRFLEIGKRDIYQDSRLGLWPFRRKLSFTAIDLDGALRERPILIAGLFKDVIDGLNDRSLFPLAHRVLPISEATSALRTLSQAKHIGKIVLSMRASGPVMAAAFEDPLHFQRAATYLITGGLGDFGLAVAEWIVEKGAGHLVLMGRREPSPEALKMIEKLRRRGAEVVVRCADVSDPEQLASVLRSIDESQPPLKGVFHAAAVFKDCVLSNLTEERLRKVWAPKVQGAWNLHCQTLGKPLDHFVLFSSLAAFLGNAGQAGYAAANAFLDSLAHFRKGLGLPATAIGWGRLGQVGWAARHRKVARHLEAIGILGLRTRQALGLLERLLRERATYAAVLKIDWQRWHSLAAAGWIPGRVRQLIDEESRRAVPNEIESAVLQKVLAAPIPERPAMIESLLRDRLARVLGASPDKLDSERPLTELGLDSLMGIELRNWVEKELRINLPSVELLRGPSIARLSEFLLQQLNSDRVPGPRTEADPDNGRDVLEELDELSEEEIDALLAESMKTEGEPNRVGEPSDA